VIRAEREPRPAYPLEFDPRPRIVEPGELVEESEPARPSR
jgi:hypothetical protein